MYNTTKDDFKQRKGAQNSFKEELFNERNALMRHCAKAIKNKDAPGCAVEIALRKFLIKSIEPIIFDNNRHEFTVDVNGKLRAAWYVATSDYIIADSLLVSYGLTDERAAYGYFSHAGRLDELEKLAQLRLRHL